MWIEWRLGTVDTGRTTAFDQAAAGEAAAAVTVTAPAAATLVARPHSAQDAFISDSLSCMSRLLYFAAPATRTPSVQASGMSSAPTALTRQRIVLPASAAARVYEGSAP